MATATRRFTRNPPPLGRAFTASPVAWLPDRDH
jgi:hypothetical protein